jgi:uncharacterized metal-binding protein
LTTPSNSVEDEAVLPQCARCPFPIEQRLCRNPKGNGPASCPVRDKSMVELSMGLYRRDALREFAVQASLQEACCYEGREPGNRTPRPVKPRLLETAEFAGRMGYERLGLVFCSGVREEAAAVDRFLAHRGFQVVSVMCKAGGVPKEKLGLAEGDKVVPGSFEPICNPVLQALLLDRAGTCFNIVLGLCVGHDSLFLMHSKAPCTVLAAKDRTNGHNPMAAVYTLDSYTRYLFEED